MNRSRQPIWPGGPVRQPYFYSVPSPIDPDPDSKIPALIRILIRTLEYESALFISGFHSK